MPRRLVCTALLAACWTAPLSAQHLRDLFRDLFAFGTCGRPLCLDGSVNADNGHGDHFLPDLIASNSAVIGFLTDAIAQNAAAAPLAASSGGITYKFVGGLPVRTSESAGPIFAERAQTIGRGQVFLGAHVSASKFATIRGTPMDRIILNFTHQDVAPEGLGDPLLENDVLHVNLALDVRLTVINVFATWGLSDAVDLSVALPLVHTSLQGRSHAQVLPFGATAVHFFTGTPENPGLTAQSATFGSATGLGDVSLRLKANLHSDERLALAVLGDARLPTGDERDLTGAGALTFRALAIASGRFAEFSPHLNLGYVHRGGAERNDAVLATLGFDRPMSDWATLAVDVISEWQTSANRLALPGTVTFAFPFHRTVEPTNIPDEWDHRVHAALGFKFRTSGGPTILTNALVPVRRGGLQPNVMWTAGVDFNF